MSIEEAGRLLAEGETREAVRILEDSYPRAAESRDREQLSKILVFAREAATQEPGYEPAVRLVESSQLELERRDTDEAGAPAASVSGRSVDATASTRPRRSSKLRRARGEASWERWAGLLIVVLGVVAALSVVGGIVLGVQLAKETTDGLFVDETTYDATVLAAWVAGGTLSAVLLLVAMAVLGLLRSILRELRLGRGRIAAPPASND